MLGAAIYDINKQTKELEYVLSTIKPNAKITAKKALNLNTIQSKLQIITGFVRLCQSQTQLAVSQFKDKIVSV